MGKPIRWSRQSLEHLEDVYSFVAQDSPYYASLLIEKIFEAVERLNDFPEMGRIVPESGDETTRELIYKGYRIIYQIMDERLEVIAVFHGSKKYDG